MAGMWLDYRGGQVADRDVRRNRRPDIVTAEIPVTSPDVVDDAVAITPFIKAGATLSCGP